MRRSRSALLAILALTLLLGSQSSFQRTLITNVQGQESNIVKNPGFEAGVSLQTGTPVDWTLAQPTFSNYAGVTNASVSLDSSLRTNGSFSARIYVGQISCDPPCPNRPIGFVEFYQRLPPNTRVYNISDGAGSLRFSFYLLPLGNGSGDIAAQVIASDGTTLSYVFDPDPHTGYVNQSKYMYLLRYGYSPGQWYNFSVDLKKDWSAVGLSVYKTLSRIEFVGYAFQPPQRSEIFWLDDVELRIGPVPPGGLPPMATFFVTPPSALPGIVITFNAIGSRAPEGTITTYSWNFGDGSPTLNSSSSSISHKYNVSGIYLVTLRITDSRMLSDADSQDVFIEQVKCPLCPTAKAILSGSKILVGTTITMNATLSTDPRREPLQFFWDFGDGTTGMGGVVTHRYTSSADVIVTLTVIDRSGLNGTTEATLTVSEINAVLTGRPHLQSVISGFPRADMILNFSMINTGNLPVRVLVSASVTNEEFGLEKRVNSSVVVLGVRMVGLLPVSYNQPDYPGRYTLVIDVFIFVGYPGYDSTGWVRSDHLVLSYRVVP